MQRNKLMKKQAGGFLIAKDLSPSLLLFIQRTHAMTLRALPEDKRIAAVKRSLAELLATQEWLPDWALTLPLGIKERDTILATDIDNGPMITLVSWNEGQVGKVHDHRTWGALGVVKGCERCVSYECVGKKGDIFEDCTIKNETALSTGDIYGMPHNIIHRMKNVAEDNAVSVSLHVYGKDLRYTHRSIYNIDQKHCFPNPNTEFFDLT